MKAATAKKAGYRRHCQPIYLIAVFLPTLLLAAVSLDLDEVSNREYLQFVLATGHQPPEYWIRGRYPEGMHDEPVVLVNWHDAAAYCRWAGGKRLPTVDEWMTTCKTGKLIKRGNVWEWTLTDVPMGNETFKALCGPGDSCDCSHRYLPEWKNEVKGFRCAQGAPFLTRHPLFFGGKAFA